MKPRTFLGGLVALFLSLQANLADDRQLIWTGWDIPTTDTFADDIPAFEEWNLFDGSAMIPTRQRANGSTERVRDAFNNVHWDWSEFQVTVSKLQSAKPKQCTNNFLLITANPGNVDWFDDEGWTEITDHWRLLARVAKKGGLSGLMFDAEPYSPPWSQFLYSAQPSKSKYSFAETQAKARQRGREVMKAVAEEYPNTIIFAYRLFSDLLHSGDRTKQGANLQTGRYGLLPAFVDGWCDVMPATITIIDGDEAASHNQQIEQYSAAFARIKIEAPRLVSPENRSKIRRQLLVGHDIYLDSLLPDSPIPIDLHGASPASHLLAFTSEALDSTDGLVWVYGEKGRFWPAKGSTQPPWPSKIAGIEAALKCAKEPTQFARDVLAKASSKNNLLRDTSFSNGGWSRWQEAGSKGAGTLSGGVATLIGMNYGSVGQTVTVKPGEAYIIAAKLKQTGPGTAGVLINWKNNNRFVAQSDIVEFFPSDSRAESEWRQTVGVVIVPSEANALMFLCVARGQQAEDAEAAFKDPVLLRALP